MFRLLDVPLLQSRAALADIPEGKILINTINAHSYNVAQKDSAFAAALSGGDFLIPDGAGIVKACHWLGKAGSPLERVAGWDLFCFEMERVSKLKRNPRVMFLGSSPQVLCRIAERAAADYPGMEVRTYSPPYKAEFSEEENAAMVEAVNSAEPDLLWLGMTAPKQEKWAWEHWKELDIACHAGTVGAVFDFYAGTARRAPQWWQEHSLEWLYRLLHEPRRMWKRYVVGNPLFILNILKEKLHKDA
ncbi:MAG: WecB/TagA/CpsF family glycosyltransferase [Bacteroidales bacterium]|nr:WecB/TagA/CpsF family glycosyltransferase [Bacteroidales bacterium]